MSMKTDNFILGIILGIIAPIIGMVAFKMMNFPTTDYGQYLHDIFIDKSYRPLLSGMLTVSLIANAFVFSAFIHFNKDKSAKGVFITTAIYGVIILLVKLLM